MVVDVMISPRSYMDFEQKYQKDPGMNRVKVNRLLLRKLMSFKIGIVARKRTA